MTSLPMNGGISVAKKELLRGTGLAALVAGLILTVAILPAEYGIDPTGIGKALGLTTLHRPATAAADSVPAPQGSQVSAPGEERALTIASKQTVPYRSDEQEITLAPGKGLEVKTHLAKGATLIYSWETKGGAVVNHDFHGEPVNAREDEFESFIADKGVSSSSGSLIAPFTGVHGWYWKNKSAEPVTLVLRSSGFYADIYKK